MSEAESFDHAGLKVRICWEEDNSFCNPRDNDNLGTMVCWHPDYYLGDYQITTPEGRGAVKDRFDRDDFQGLEVLERYLHLALKAPVTIPLYLYDHSGISMSAGAPNVWDNPRIKTDHHGNGLGWDTTMVGYVYTTPERMTELCGAPDYCPKDWGGTPAQWIATQLDGEVEEYNLYLTGQVYYYVIEGEDGETLDSCGGFLGSEYVEEAAKEAAEYQREHLDAEAAKIAPYRFAPETLTR